MSIRNMIEIDQDKCDGCGNCIIACAEGAIELRHGKAVIIKESYCDGLGACVGECPQGALTIVAREADPFDEEAVKEHLEDLRIKGRETPGTPDEASCPGTKLMHLRHPAHTPVRPKVGDPASKLRNWPVQIHLLPASAPFFKTAHLLIAGDCVAFAMGDFHERLLHGNILAVGCPKLDNITAYLEKLTQIFIRNDIQAVKIAYMEVPCCAGLVRLVQKALEASGKAIPLSTVKVSAQGDVLEEEELGENHVQCLS